MERASKDLEEEVNHQDMDDFEFRIANRGFEQALTFGRVRRRDELQAGDVGIPGRIALRVLCGDARSSPVRPAEHDRAAHLPAGHRRSMNSIIAIGSPYLIERSMIWATRKEIK